jgi:uncharacterized UPF0146 family protein
LLSCCCVQTCIVTFKCSKKVVEIGLGRLLEMKIKCNREDWFRSYWIDVGCA